MQSGAASFHANNRLAAEPVYGSAYCLVSTLCCCVIQLKVCNTTQLNSTSRPTSVHSDLHDATLRNATLRREDRYK